MKKYFLILITLLMCLSHCSNKNSINLKKNQLIIGIVNEPENLNPLFPLSNISFDVYSLIFNNLLSMDEDLVNFSPELAKNCFFSKDSMDITFILNSNIYWQDGIKLTADDVAFTFQLQTDKRVAWDGISYKQNIKNVEVVDDTSVIFHFSKKTPFMLMDANEGEILPKHILSKYDPQELFQSDFSHKPVGSGPYKLTTWENQQYIILEKNDYYFRDSKPHIQKVIFKVVNDKSILIQQLLNEEVDAIYNLTSNEIDRISSLSGKIKIAEWLGKDYDFIGWNCIDKNSYDSLKNYIAENPEEFIPKVKPNKFFGDPEVRRALSMIIDREKICQVLSHNVAVPITKPYIMHKNFDHSIDDFYIYDIEAAKNILKKQGWIDHDGNGTIDKNGVEFDFVMYTNAGNPMREQLLLILEQELKKLQIKMTPRIVDGNFLVSEIISTKSFDAILLGWLNSIKPDFTMLFHSSQYLHPFQFTGYYSPTFDSLCQQNTQTESKETYYDSLHKIVNLLQKDAPYTWLYYKKNNAAYNHKIINFQSSVVKKFKYLEDYRIDDKELAE